MLPKNRRISSDSDWQKIHKKGFSVHSKEYVIKFLKNNSSVTRFGFIVGTKIQKKATKRNQIKRRLRSAVQKLHKSVKRGHDVIIISKAGIVNKNYKEIEERMIKLLSRARLLK